VDRFAVGLEHEFRHHDLPAVTLQLLLVLGVGVFTAPRSDR